MKKIAMMLSVAALLAMGACQSNQKAKTCSDPAACKEACGGKCDGKCDGSQACCTDGKKAKVDATPINKICPIGGHGAEKMVVVAYKGKNIGFCCNDCVESFNEMDAKGKDEILAKAEADAAKNMKS